MQSTFSDAPSNYDPGQPLVAILMGTYRGEQYLSGQLASIEAQDHSRWKVWASDDQSDDGTIAILRQYQAKWGTGRLAILSGPRRGFCPNFLSLVCNPEIMADFFTFCDQDDVWEVGHLSRALRMIPTVQPGTPAMYFARTKLVNDRNEPVGFSPLFRSAPCFKNALVQSIGGANTMLFNPVVATLLRKAGADVDVQSHDWWVYVVTTACGGKVYYDAVPTVRYRQHGGNLVGSNIGWVAQKQRVKLLLDGEMRRLIDRNIVGLGRLSNNMTSDCRRTLDLFCRARKQWLLPRLVGIYRSGVFRQRLVGHIGLAVGAVTGRL